MEEENKIQLPTNSKVKVDSFYLKTNTSFINLYCIKVTPITQDTPKASILIFHSLFEDSSEYIPLATHLAAEGSFECYMIDFRGFGYSSGTRAYVDLIELQQDVFTLIQEVHNQNIQRQFTLPTFVITSSYSSNVVAGLLINNPHLPLAGVIMCSPAFTEDDRRSTLPIVDQMVGMCLGPLMHVKLLKQIDCKKEQLNKPRNVSKR